MTFPLNPTPAAFQQHRAPQFFIQLPLILINYHLNLAFYSPKILLNLVTNSETILLNLVTDKITNVRTKYDFQWDIDTSTSFGDNLQY